jgi:hypothetical protein
MDIPTPTDTLFTVGNRVHHATHGFGYVWVSTKTTVAIQFDAPVGYKEFQRQYMKPSHYTLAPPER